MSTQQTRLIQLRLAVFSWRPALTDSLLPSAPRQAFPGLLAEHIFTLYTYLSVLALSSSLLARSQSSSNGVSYELSPSLPAAERRIRDEHVGRAADGLCRAAGVAEYLLPLVGQWEQEVWTGKGKSPVEGSRSFTSAVAKVLLADAQLLSIRKLLSPTLSTSPHVGPPLAKGHPSPSLLAKLYLSVLSFYSQAFTLLSSSSSSRSKGSEDTQTDAPIPDLVKYVKTNRDFVQALSRKWLGVDAGESAGGERIGEAIAWLKDAKATLAEGSRGPVGKLSKSKVEGKWKEELDSVNAFLSAYEKSNNSVRLLVFVPGASHKDSLTSTILTGLLLARTPNHLPIRPHPCRSLCHQCQAVHASEASLWPRERRVRVARRRSPGRGV